MRVPEASDEIATYLETGKPIPWHYGNALSIEGFGARDGRVVIESTTFALTIIGKPAWEMTNTEEARQRLASAEAMESFMKALETATPLEREPESETRDDDFRPSPRRKPGRCRPAAICWPIASRFA